MRARPRGLDGDPTLGVLSLLAMTIGLPYVLLASTGPLLQAWLVRRPGAAPPYRLFALSNLASLAALLGYPVLVEPSIPWRRQAIGWALAYLGFALLSAAAALRAARAGSAGAGHAGRGGGGLRRPGPGRAQPLDGAGRRARRCSCWR